MPEAKASWLISWIFSQLVEDSNLLSEEEICVIMKASLFHEDTVYAEEMWSYLRIMLAVSTFCWLPRELHSQYMCCMNPSHFCFIQ